MDLNTFTEELKNCQDNQLPTFCRKYLIHGTPFIFKNREADFFHFIERIANHFSIDFKDIYITGSAKLGFSPFKGTEFSLESDIDVAIVSETLFNEYMHKICDYAYKLRNYEISQTSREDKQYYSFLQYIAIGWIRPDKLPSIDQSYSLKSNWFDYFNSISYDTSEVGNYKVTAGIYKNHIYYEKYLINTLMQIKQKNTIL